VGLLTVQLGCSESDQGTSGESEDTAAEAFKADRHARVWVCDGAAYQPRSLRLAKNQVNRAIREGGYLGPCADFGDRRTLGKQALQTYAQILPDETPYAIGFLMPGDFFAGLPLLSPADHDHGVHDPEMRRTDFDGENCFDVNGNGTLELDGSVSPENPLHHDECIGGYQAIMDFPVKDKIAPFKWALINWVNQGHTPNGIYNIPHFDFHFFTLSYRERNFIRLGPCALLINCDDFERAIAPLPEGYLNSDYISVGAAEARMGNHMVDATSGEWHGERFDHTFIFGTYDAKTVFWEPMITREFLESQPDTCLPIKVPELYAGSGWYPTNYCMRYRPYRDEYTVSLEGFVYREGSPLP
jgi:hypothetical protein